MIDVSLLSVMRRWCFREGMSQREIARRTGLSRNTVRRYLKNDITEPVYSKRQTLSKMTELKNCLSVGLNEKQGVGEKNEKPLKTCMKTWCL